MVHTIEIKVRGYHLDLFGHVNNARYLEFLEEGRWAAFEDRADLLSMARKGPAFTVVNINIAYRRPALVDQTLKVETGIVKLGSRSGVIRQVVKNSETGELVAEADVTFLFYNAKTRKVVLLEGDLLEMLQGV